MSKDIKALIAIYTILILSCWNIAIDYKSNKTVDQLKSELLEVKKIAIEINTDKNEYITVLQESRQYLNDELDLLTEEIKQYKKLEKLKKDLDRSRQ